MRNFFSAALIFNLIISAAGGSIAQAAAQKRVFRPMAGPAAGVVELGAAPTAPKTTPTGGLVAILPASDLIAVVDFGRAFNELLPKLAGLSVGGVDKLAKSIQDFTLKTGIDPSKIQSAAVSMTMDGSQGIGVIIIQGIDPNPKQ